MAVFAGNFKSVTVKLSRNFIVFLYILRMPRPKFYFFTPIMRTYFENSDRSLFVTLKFFKILNLLLLIVSSI